MFSNNINNNKLSISNNDKETIRNNGATNEEKVYCYDEAIELAGNGRYNYGLLATVSLIATAMALDMFGFSMVVAGCSCDFQLGLSEKSVLLSAPFLGPIVMSYPWGYISDTRGRRKSLVIAMWCSFFVNIISVFSPNWITTAVLKFISTSFCSCAQSVTYALLGESVAERLRTKYMIIMTSFLMITPTCYFSIAYGILELDFSYNLGVVSFTHWRLLVLILALPLGISALCLGFFYESPKFIASIGREDEAVELLKKIWRRNGGELEKYPVKKLVLNEDGIVKDKDISFLQSLWDQTAPLFKPPLLVRTLQLYYLTAMIYSANNSFVMWFPFISDAFFAGVSSSSDNQAQGVCNMIISSQNIKNSTSEMACTSSVELRTALSSIVLSIIFTTINLCMSKLPGRKKMMTISLLILSSASGLAATVIPNNVASFVFFVTFLIVGLCIGTVFSYFIDLYPVSYRGMVSCLAVLVARTSSLIGINFVGAFVMDYCTTSFYVWSAYIFSGVVVACFLPPDKAKKSNKTDVECTKI